ncbi:MAG: RNA-binding protein [Gammaproteobacteria bacterium]
MKKIYVGNLPWTATEEDVREFFSEYGDVGSVAIIVDRETGRSRGFGFVEMEDSEADRAIEEANGQSLGGRTLRVNEAQERRRPSGPPRGRRDLDFDDR